MLLDMMTMHQHHRLPIIKHLLRHNFWIIERIPRVIRCNRPPLNPSTLQPHPNHRQRRHLPKRRPIRRTRIHRRTQSPVRPHRIAILKPDRLLPCILMHMRVRPKLMPARLQSFKHRRAFLAPKSNKVKSRLHTKLVEQIQHRRRGYLIRSIVIGQREFAAHFAPSMHLHPPDNQRQSVQHRQHACDQYECRDENHHPVHAITQNRIYTTIADPPNATASSPGNQVPCLRIAQTNNG